MHAEHELVLLEERASDVRKEVVLQRPLEEVNAIGCALRVIGTTLARLLRWLRVQRVQGDGGGEGRPEKLSFEVIAKQLHERRQAELIHVVDSLQASVRASSLVYATDAGRARTLS